MKIAKVLMSFFALVMLTACIKDDLSDCENVILRFSYKGDGVEEIFSEKISRVDLYVFDEQNRCVTTHTLSAKELAAQSVTLWLAQGTYHAVCIANAFEGTSTEIGGARDFTEMIFRSRAIGTAETIASADPLYHGATDFVAYNGGKTEALVPVHASHFDVCVEVKGYSEAKYEKTAAAPVVTMDGLPAFTDFTNNPSPDERLTLSPAAAKEDDLHVYRFNTMRDVSQARLVLTTSDGRPVYTLSIPEFLAAHPEIDLKKQEALLPIHIEFLQLDVIVSIPDWAIKDATPEF